MLKPCARCYRARNFVKDGMGRIFQRPATHTEYTIEWGGVVLVENGSNKIVGETNAHWITNRGLIGAEVYASKGKLTAIETGKVVALYTRRQRIHINTTT